MKQLYYWVTDRRGFHVRPAIMVSKCMKKLQCDVIVEYNGHVESGKDQKGMLAMGVPKGGLMIFSVRGKEEDLAIEQLEAVLQDWEKGNLRF